MTTNIPIRKNRKYKIDKVTLFSKRTSYFTFTGSSSNEKDLGYITSKISKFGLNSNHNTIIDI